MGFLLRTFAVSFGIFAALLFWWRPAPVLISVQPVDWAIEYKKHPPGKFLWGATTVAKETIGVSTPEQSLKEYIHQKTKDRLIRVGSDAWAEWAKSNFPGDDNKKSTAVFLRPTDPLATDLPSVLGYIEMRGRNRIDYFRYNRLAPSELGGKNIPPELRFPYRAKAGMIFGAAALLMAVFGFSKRLDNRISKSSAGKGCKVFVPVLTGGAALIILPFLYGWHHDFPPFVFIGGFVAICGLIGFFMFSRQVVMISNMIQEKNVLAHWTYVPAEWQRFADWAFTAEKEEKRGLLMVVSAIIVLVGGGFWLAMRDEAAGWVFLFLMGLMVFLWLIVLVPPRLTHRRNSQKSGEVFLGPSGLYLNGTVHSWSFPGSRFEFAQYTSSPFPLLSVTYSYITSAGRSLAFFRQEAVVHLPVPEGKEGEAEGLVEKYQMV